MIDSVFELVNKTASNSLFMFLFCNFIIILILLGHSKPASQHNSNPGLQQTMLTSDPIISTKPGFQRFVLISATVLSPKPGFEKSESIISSNSKPGFQKSESAPSSKSQRVSISEPIAVTTKPGLQEPVMISMSALSSKPAITEQFRTSKPGLRKMSSGLKPGSEFSEKDGRDNEERELVGSGDSERSGVCASKTC